MGTSKNVPNRETDLPSPISSAEKPQSMPGSDSSNRADILQSSTLTEAYNKNEVNADLIYQKNIYSISGIVDDVDYAALSDDIYIRLEGSGISTVRVTLLPNQAQKLLAAKLVKGMTVIAKGRVKGSDGISGVLVEDGEIVAINDQDTTMDLEYRYSPTTVNRFIQVCRNSFKNAKEDVRRVVAESCGCGVKVMQSKYTPAQFTEEVKAIEKSGQIPPDANIEIIRCQLRGAVSQAVQGTSPERTRSIEPASSEFNFPQASCGDKSTGSGVTWYPVFIDGGDVEEIRKQFCQDAFATTRQKNGRPTVQVASFNNYARAKAFAQQINGEVGEPIQR